MSVIALLGTGIMGSAMARNLLREGMEVRAWNRTKAKAEPLEAGGAAVADSPAAAVDGAEVIITMLNDGQAVLDAMRAAVPGLRAGQVWAQMSTVGVGALQPLAALAGEQGLTFVDAPVQGTKQPAEQGQLVILAAGPEPARVALKRPFDAIGQRTVWLSESGEAGAGTRLKLSTVSYGITLTNIVAEALALAKGLGIDPALFGEIVTGGPMDSPYLQAKMKAILAGDFTTSFSVRNAEKDTRLITEAGESAGVRLDLVAAAGDRFRRAERHGHGDQDMAATYFASFED